MPERIVALLAYEGFQILDLTGPAAVFESANYFLKRPAYELDSLSEGGEVRSSSGIVVTTRDLARVPRSRIDSFLIMGAAKPEVIAAIRDPLVGRGAALGRAFQPLRLGLLGRAGPRLARSAQRQKDGDPLGCVQSPCGELRRGQRRSRGLLCC